MKIGWLIFLPPMIFIIWQSLIISQTYVMASIAVLFPCSLTFILDAIGTEWSIRTEKKQGTHDVAAIDKQSIFTAINSSIGTIIFLLIIGLFDVQGPAGFILIGIFIGPFIFGMVATVLVHSIRGPQEIQNRSYEENFPSS